jgi:hypothetical protein
MKNRLLASRSILIGRFRPSQGYAFLGPNPAPATASFTRMPHPRSFQPFVHRFLSLPVHAILCD